MKKKASIVIGLGYGDEGKGSTTDYLAFKAINEGEKPLVIRFNGGQQAGHTVMTSSRLHHVFSNFGAGTLRNVPTYWSSYCTFAPGNYLKEWEALRQLGTFPRLYLDGRCPVTTHYDVLYNRCLEDARGTARHGSCGLGFGATVERHDTTPYKLFAQDLFFPETCKHKLAAIRTYYREKFSQNALANFADFDHDAADTYFFEQTTQIAQHLQNGYLHLVTEKSMFKNDEFTYYLFEGAQGILLDMDFGCFPHVTRSHTTSKNALEIIARNLPALLPYTQIYYVTRCYQTRHGAGPLACENEKISLINNELETNRFNDYQGNFRLSPLKLDNLLYALQADQHFSEGLTKNLVFTCLDQLNPEAIPFFVESKKIFASPLSIANSLNMTFEKILGSFSPCGEYMRRIIPT